MPQYVVKVLIELEARDDIEARRLAAELASKPISGIEAVRDIVVHSKADNKSIKMNRDGTFPGNWNKGGSGNSAHTAGPR